MTLRGLQNVQATFGQDNVLTRTMVSTDADSPILVDGMQHYGPADFSWLLEPAR